MLFCQSFATAQQTTQIKLIKADRLSPGTAIGINGQRLLGNVHFSHQGTLMSCDSAYLYQESNSMDAFGNVYINDNDSVFINADSLHYDGNLRFCELHYSVKLRDQKMKLTTPHLTYDLTTKVANYYGSGRIIDKDNTLKSEVGYYYVRTKTFFYKKNVVLVNPKYTMNSDTLTYHSDSKIAEFSGPTKIVSEKNTIYCENGWYNTQNDISQFNKNAYIITENQLLKGDSLYYNRNKDHGRAFDNVYLIDTVQNYIVQGNFGEYFGQEGRTIFTDSTLATILDSSKDSLFLHSDSLIVLTHKEKAVEKEKKSAKKEKNKKDKTKEASEDPNENTKVDYILAYHKTKFFKTDLQGLCDSLVYNYKDSTIEMYGKPVVWANNSQISGETIIMKTKDEKPEKLFIKESSFIFSPDSNNHFNQVGGKDMEGTFENSDLRNMKVFGNSETIYFVRDDAKVLIGVNIAISGDLELELEDKGIKKIKYFDKPDATLNPEKSLSERDMLLRGFKNQEINKPKSKMDVFEWQEIKVEVDN